MPLLISKRLDEVVSSHRECECIHVHEFKLFAIVIANLIIKSNYIRIKIAVNGILQLDISQSNLDFIITKIILQIMMLLPDYEIELFTFYHLTFITFQLMMRIFIVACLLFVAIQGLKPN